MKRTFLLIGCIFFIVLYITQTSGVKCGQTDCNTDDGKYCCAKDPSDSSAPKKCCCKGVYPQNYSQTCSSSSGLPIWGVVIIVIVILGIIGGVIAGIIIYRRRRLA